MNRNFGTRKAALIGLLVISIDAAAQQQVSALMTGMAANAKQLRQYSFKQRTETYHQGDLKNTKVDEIHYSASGERVSIPLNDQKAQSEPRRRDPGSRIIAKKIEEEQEKMKEYISPAFAVR